MKRVSILLALAAVLGLAAGVFAQPANPGPGTAPPPTLGEGKGQVVLSWDEFVKVTGYDPTKKGNQVLTIPWKDVQALLGPDVKLDAPMHMTTVDLPWTDFKALLEWSVRKREKETVETPPPTDFIITSSQYTGTLSADSAEFTLAVKLDVLRKNGWKRIPVLPMAVALTRTTLPEGVYLNSGERGYELLTEKSGPIEVALSFSVAVSKAAGISTVSFERMTGGSAVLDVVPEGDSQKMDVKVIGAQSSKVVESNKHILAALPTGQPVSITWEVSLPKVEAAPTRLYSETQTLVAVADGVLVCQEEVDFNILHTAVRELRLTVPKGVSVLEVVGRNIQDWRVETSGQLLVIMRGTVIGPTEVRVSYEMPVTADVQIPVLRAVGVEREKGYVGVIALANVEIDAGQVEGATGIDVKQLPPDISAMTKQPILLGFRYVGEKVGIPLVIKKHSELTVLATIVDSALATTMQLDDGRRMTRMIYTVRNNRNQFLRLDMPARAEIWSAAVGGNTVTPAKDEKGSVLIPLIRSAATAQELTSFPVELVYVETPEKAAPAGGKMHVEFPRVDVEAPTMHVMVNYYAPGEGKYGRPGGLFAPAQSGFSGTLRLVDKFATMATDRAEVVAVEPNKQAQAMQQQFEAKMEAEAKATGASPIRVRLPVEGRLFKLEKILALPKDNLFFDVEYSDWNAAK